MKDNMNLNWLFRPFLLLCSILIIGMTISCAGVKQLFRTNIPLSEVEEGHEYVKKSGIPEKGSDSINDPYTNFIMASLLMNRGNFDEAKPYLEKAVKNDAQSIYLKKKMAFLLERLKDYGGAIKYARESVDLAPEDISARLLLAEILAVSGDEKSALEEYKKILELKPEQQRVRLILVSNFIRSREYSAAMEHLNILIHQNPNLDIAYYYRGRINLEMEQYEDAERDYLKALDLTNNMEQHALFDLAGLYLMQKRYEESAQMYERLISRYPTNLVARERLINIYYKLDEKEKADNLIEEFKGLSKPGDPRRQALGLIYLQHGKLDESIMELDLIVTAWPDDQKSRYYLAVANEEKGEYEKALEHFMLIKEDSEYYISALMRIAYILEKQERYDEAIDILEKAIETNSEETELYLLLASVYETKQEYDKAIKILEKGMLIDRDNIDLIFRTGVIYDKSGDKERSLEQMKKILTIDENYADALNYIGYTYAEQGIRLEEAQKLIEKAIKLKPESGYIIDSLGWVYYQKGLYDKAIVSLEKAFSLIPTDPTVAEHLGDVYFKIEEYEKSLKMYEKALSLNHYDEDKINRKIEEVKRLLEKD